ncbi:capsular biosynthesis protein [Planococcus sp. ANT_H30]|uniref:YveK family protein n=1 Tax=Planococcus sp. ANT_H30 TaxID=2597347 RepID=UPI0011ECE504|nr:Wzz/FepE/Etk N-terminal domain-containing protein [Planococcus sp. ANT_H30]KAA0958724.1 capsular biosynthesis protein [Planococcus sp. ANT_H30]
MEEGISLRDVFKIIGNYKVLILSIVVVFGLTAGLVSHYVLPPVYETSTQIVVHQNDIKTGKEINQNNEADLQLIETYSDIIENPGVLAQVSERQNLALTAEQMNKQVTVTTNTNSHVINISVRDSDIERAVVIANTTVEVFSEEVSRLLNANNVSVISPAANIGIPTPVAPNVALNTAIASLIGLLFGTSLAFLSNYMNTTIKNEQEVERLLDIPVLAIIPFTAVKETRGEQIQTTFERKEV